MGKRGFIILALFLILIPLINTEEFGYNTIDQNQSFGYNTGEAPSIINYVNASNHSAFWDTNIGALDNVNGTVFENNGGILNIIIGWFESKFALISEPLWTNNFTLYNNSWSSTINNSYLRDTGDTATGNYTFDTTTFFIDSLHDRIGIGTNAPDSIFHIKANTPGTVGSHPAGQLIIQDPDDTVFGNVVITGYESDGAGNPDQQLWYLGSSSGSNTDITFLNRRNANLHLGTNGVSRLTILGGGNIGIGTTSPDSKLQIDGNFTSETNATDSIGTLLIQWLQGFFVNLFVSGDLEVGGLIINDAIYCESSELIDQDFGTAGKRYRLNISNVDEGNGITMSTAKNGTNITIDTSGVYHMVAQPQVKAGAVGGGKGDFHMWLEKYVAGSSWTDIADSNIELSLGTNEEDVVVLATTLKLNQGEKIRLVASVSDNNVLLHAQSPAGEPVIPSIIFTMYRVGS